MFQLSGLLGQSGAQLGRSMSSGTHGKEGSPHMWKPLTNFVELPGVGVSMLSVFLKLHHGEHKRPEFIAYPISKSGPSPFPGDMVIILYSITLT